ncbi:CaiB/BaiF CoA transferase family protein [Mesorhizobium sp. ANAO-SY3R2]|uniref:CaiB/BaiF CoA transferase family protein n=1 Tax=Mesorhizobium sp. ANAO-SY3R2 TaxID=3166644 RepID=UPI003671D8C6
MSFNGVRIVDLTRVISGPFCSALLADLGADVIKVESPGEGDPLRGQGYIAGSMSTYFANYNRNKRGIAIDLYSAAGKEVLERLLSDADVLIENYRPDVMTRMGFSPERLNEINPSLIHCNINGFGVDGPYADRPAFDFVVQAMSGFMATNGAENDPPMRSGTPIADLVCGLYAALGVASALHNRSRGNSGRTINVSMLASLMSMLSFHATDYLNSGKLVSRSGNDHGLVAPYGLFGTADGQIAVAPSNGTFYARLVKILELPELNDDPRFGTNADRMARRSEINALVEAKTKTRTTAYWIDVLNRAGVPCGPVYGIDQAFSDPQVVSQKVAVEIEANDMPLRILGSPIRFAGEEDFIRLPPPRLGQHTDEILMELGFSSGDVAALREQRVI